MLIDADKLKIVQIKELAESLGFYVFQDYRIAGVKVDFVFLSCEDILICNVFSSRGTFVQQEDNSWVNADNSEIVVNLINDAVKAKNKFRNILNKSHNVFNKIKNLNVGVILTEASIKNAVKYKSKWIESQVLVACFENSNEKYIIDFATVLENMREKVLPSKQLIEDVRYILALAKKEEIDS